SGPAKNASRSAPPGSTCGPVRPAAPRSAATRRRTDTPASTHAPARILWWHLPNRVNAGSTASWTTRWRNTDRLMPPRAPRADRPPRERRPYRRFFADLGPGLITGAADDDPSGISTYSVAGATFGYVSLWTALVSFPLMTAVQVMCARLGLVTGLGL